MASDPKAIAVVIMGVSGSGKSTIGEMLGKALNCSFIDADDFHPQSNKEKMKKGIPLSDEDRIPWLEVLRDVLNANLVSGKTVILGCSALQKQYRDILRSADPHDPCAVKFVLLDVGVNLLMDRVQKRAAEGKHFMPVELLQSQIDLLQVDESEGIFKVDASLIPEAIVDDIKSSRTYTVYYQNIPWRRICEVSRKELSKWVCLDSFSEHAVHCKELPGFKYRHDLVMDVLCDVIKRAGISAKKEAPVNFLTDPLEGRSILRPADILVFGWAWGNTLVWTLQECPLS